MSAKTGLAPSALTALAVATNVNGGRSTSSPGCTPHARNAKISASVPEATPTPWATPQSLAISSSSAAPSRPRTNCWEAITRSTAVRISPPMAAYCAARSSCGTGSSGEGIRGCEVMALARVQYTSIGFWVRARQRCALSNSRTEERKRGRTEGHPYIPSQSQMLIPYNDAASRMFAKRTNWDMTPNRLSEALAAHRTAGKPLIDLTMSNPTECGFEYDSSAILDALRNPAALAYEPNPRGLESARRAVSGYYADRGDSV